MKDRLVEFPNRFRLQEVGNGIYDILPQPGNVTEEGTPLNKANLLSDPVAARYGLDAEGTPTQAFQQAVQELNATIPASGWSTGMTNGYYTNRVAVDGMKAAYNPVLVLNVTSATLAEDERSAFGTIIECETFDGYIIAKCLDKPDISINVRFIGV